MKASRLFCCLAACLFLVSSCYDDSSLREEIQNMKERLDKLEEKCRLLNADICTIQGLVVAMSQNGYVTSISKTDDGALITMNSGMTFRVSASAGGSSSICVKKGDDDKWYWTIDGEWLLDSGGRRLEVSARTPVYKADEHFWYVSVDEGRSWITLSRVDDGAPVLFDSVRFDDQSVTLVLADGTELSLYRKYDVDEEELDLQIMSLNSVLYPFTGLFKIADYKITNASAEAKVSAFCSPSSGVLIKPLSSSEGEIFVNGNPIHFVTDDHHILALTVICVDGGRTVIRTVNYPVKAVDHQYETVSFSIEGGHASIALKHPEIITSCHALADYDWLQYSLSDHGTLEVDVIENPGRPRRIGIRLNDNIGVDHGTIMIDQDGCV